MMGSHRAYRAGMALALLTPGCRWFEAETCRVGASACKGDTVRTCELDTASTAESGEPVHHWTDTTKCIDDTQLGRTTCRVLRGQAACVPEGATTTTGTSDTPAPPATPTEWLRIDVRRDGEVLSAAPVTTAMIAGTPPTALSGSVAAVAYEGDAVADAALVPVTAAGQSASVWLRRRGVTRVALVDGRGAAVAMVSLAPTGGPDGNGNVEAVSSPDLSPTLRVLARNGLPTPEMLNLISSAFQRFTPAAGAVIADVDFTEGPSVDLRVQRDGSLLHVNVHPALLEAYRTDPLPLFEDVAREVGSALAERIYAIGEGTVGAFIPLRPTSFPSTIQGALHRRLSPLLGSGETFEDTWAALHQIALDGQFGRAYLRDVPRQPPDDAEAASEGFASAKGAQSPLDDFIAFYTHSHVEERWTFGPCSDFRDRPLDQLPAHRVVVLSKLLVLRGLELLSADRLRACTGELRVASGAPNITFHKANGERIALTEEAEGVRQPYFDNDVELSWSAKRSYLTAMLNVAYRGYRPALLRLSSAADKDSDKRTENYALASLTLTNPAGAYTTTVAQAGLVSITDVSPTRFHAYALMVRLDKQVAGTKVFPLVSAQIQKPTWTAELDQ